MRDRTADLLRARQALSQLSYSPVTGLFCAAFRCTRPSVGHIGLLCSLLLSSRASISTQNPALQHNCVASNHEACQVNQKCVNRGGVPRRIACYASGAPTMSDAVLVGLGRFELPTSPLSGVRSNQLSYRPVKRVCTLVITFASTD
jgi:hypothetical protein